MIIFDTGSIITLAMNGLLGTVRVLKEMSKEEFVIPESVKQELVDKPIKGKKYKLEAIMINRMITQKVLRVEARIDVKNLMKLVNSIFSSKGKDISILQKGEVEALALVLKSNASAYVVDERTMRLIIEEPLSLKHLLERKLSSNVSVNENKLKQFQKMVGDVKVIRSTELMLVAYEKGVFNKYVKGVGKKEFIDALLWALRLRGAAISTDEINKLVKLES